MANPFYGVVKYGEETYGPNAEYRNRVFDSVAGTFVRWSQSLVDSSGAFYPGPGTFGVDTSDYCVEAITPLVPSYRNRVYDPTDGWVRWSTSLPDTTGTSYPGTGPWGSVSDYCVEGIT